MASLNLTNLLAITSGDKELEKKLLLMFLDNSKQCLVKMDNLKLSKKLEEEWHRSAHSLKGLALNVGADKLAIASLRAEKICNKKIYDEIISEYKKVEKEIKEIIKL